MYYGSDVIAIDYDDENFCSNCEYLIGVTGYTNATFTLTLTAHTASIIRLKPNRPQNAQLDAGDRMYFSTEIMTTTSNITISLTSVSTGFADVYVRLINYTALAAGHPILPDPFDPSTYTYSTERSADTQVLIPGPRDEENTIALITVLAYTNIRFIMVAVSNDQPVLLQLGIPQSHYVATTGNALFAIYPDPYDDLRITVTARTGDPDLFISSGDSYPYCVSGKYPW
jgi:hypothetical protein